MCGTLILLYISRFCPFLEIQNFELHFLLGGGGGAGDQKNKYVWRYDEIMIYFCTFWGGGSFLSIWGFLRSMFRFGKCFWGR